MGHWPPLSALVISSPGVRTVHCWSTVALLGSLAYQCRRKWLLESEPSPEGGCDRNVADMNDAIEEIAVRTGAELRRPCETPESAAAHPKPSILPDRPLRSRRRPAERATITRSLRDKSGHFLSAKSTPTPCYGALTWRPHTLHCEQDLVRIRPCLTATTVI